MAAEAYGTAGLMAVFLGLLGLALAGLAIWHQRIGGVGIPVWLFIGPFVVIVGLMWLRAVFMWITDCVEKVRGR
jgi:hypothetical protein